MSFLLRLRINTKVQFHILLSQNSHNHCWTMIIHYLKQYINRQGFFFNVVLSMFNSLFPPSKYNKNESSNKNAITYSLVLLASLLSCLQGGLGTQKMDPINIELELNNHTESHVAKFYTIPKAYKKMPRTKVKCLCTIYVLEKLSCTEDSPQVTSFFCQVKKSGDSRFLTDF